MVESLEEGCWVGGVIEVKIDDILVRKVGILEILVLCEGLQECGLA